VASRGRRRRAVPHGVPAHLVLLLLGGARATLAVSPAHVLIVMAGARALARRLGVCAAGAAVAGGCSGCPADARVGPLPVFLATAWAPLAVERFSRSSRLPAGAALPPSPRAGGPGHDLGAEAIVGTAILALVLLPRWPGRRAVLASAGSLVLAAFARGARSARRRGDGRGYRPGAGLRPRGRLGYSAPLAVLLESALPRFLGDPHTFGDTGFWGQPFYPSGSPFFLSLYLGPVVLLLALHAGWRGRGRLWGLAASAC